MEEMQGLGVSEGIAIGKAVCISTQIFDIYQIPLPPSGIDREVERFHAAVQRTREDLGRMQQRVRSELGSDLAGIFDAQNLVLADGAFLDLVIRRIRGEHVNAEWALQETAQEIQARFDAIDTDHLRERGQDLRDVCRYVVRSLRGLHLHALSEVSGDVVIVADDLTPSDAVRLGRENVVGFAIEHGSRTSHTTIIARSLNIPAVAGLNGINHRLAEHPEATIVLDGTNGVTILNPDAGTLSRFRGRRVEMKRQEEQLLAARDLRPVTLDGEEVRVMANIDLPEEIDDVRRYGAGGVGLYRSEFLYIEKSPRLPTEDEHVEIYRSLVEAAAPHPAIIRTYDLGGRKIARELMETREENPVLGLRGIRLTLARPDIFKTQVRALLRAAVYGDLRVMLPLVTIPEEVQEFQRRVDAAAQELAREGLELRRDFRLGIMIEVPAAALISDILAKDVDFFSIGTNDLIQYALAVDRNNEHVAGLYRPLHPAMLRMLQLVVKNAREAGIEVSLCGEMAADHRMTPILLGCGLRQLSLAPRQVPSLKRRIRELDAGPLAEIVSTCSNLGTAAEVHEFLRGHGLAGDLGARFT